jgi:hypothetical protein
MWADEAVLINSEAVRDDDTCFYGYNSGSGRAGLEVLAEEEEEVK